MTRENISSLVVQRFRSYNLLNSIKRDCNKEQVSFYQQPMSYASVIFFWSSFLERDKFYFFIFKFYMLSKFMKYVHTKYCKFMLLCEYNATHKHQYPNNDKPLYTFTNISLKQVLNR